MFQLRKTFQKINIYLFIFCFLFVISNNNITTMSLPPKKNLNKDKKISPTQPKDKKISIREYHELERALSKLSDEDNNLLITTLTDPDKMKNLYEKSQQKNTQKDEGSSTKKENNSKK